MDGVNNSLHRIVLQNNLCLLYKLDRHKIPKTTECATEKKKKVRNVEMDETRPNACESKLRRVDITPSIVGKFDMCGKVRAACLC